MRISDWSSDVCSSDLDRGAAAVELAAAMVRQDHRRRARIGGAQRIVGTLQNLDRKRTAPISGNLGDALPADVGFHLRGEEGRKCHQVTLPAGGHLRAREFPDTNIAEATATPAQEDRNGGGREAGANGNAGATGGPERKR